MKGEYEIMSNLLKSDFYKLFKMKSFYVCCIVAIAIGGITIALNCALNDMMTSAIDEMGVIGSDYSTINLKMLVPSLLSPSGSSIVPGDWFILVMIGVSLFVTTEYNSGTLKNIVARGFKREYIFLSKLVVCIIEALIIAFCFAVSCVILGMIFLGMPSDGLNSSFVTELIVTYGVDILIIAGYTSFIAMLAYLIRTTGGTIASTLCIHYLIPMVIMMCNVATLMSESESESSMSVMMSYQSNQYGDIAYYWIGTLGITVSESYTNGTIYIPILVALAYIVASCGIGLAVFKKRDVK